MEKTSFRKEGGNVYDYKTGKDGDLAVGDIEGAKALLKEAGVISKICDGIVVLGNGEISKPVTVKAKKFTKSAEEKIVAAGGKVQVI